MQTTNEKTWGLSLLWNWQSERPAIILNYGGTDG